MYGKKSQMGREIPWIDNFEIDSTNHNLQIRYGVCILCILVDDAVIQEG